MSELSSQNEWHLIYTPAIDHMTRGFDLLSTEVKVLLSFFFLPFFVRLDFAKRGKDSPHKKKAQSLWTRWVSTADLQPSIPSHLKLEDNGACWEFFFSLALRGSGTNWAAEQRRPPALAAADYLSIDWRQHRADGRLRSVTSALKGEPENLMLLNIILGPC